MTTSDRETVPQTHGMSDLEIYKFVRQHQSFHINSLTKYNTQPLLAHPWSHMNSVKDLIEQIISF